MTELTSEAAKELSKLGAAKGGRARASVLSAKERSEQAKRAVAARWAKYKHETFPLEDPKETESSTSALPFSMFRGTIKIGDMELESHVLNDERRVFTQREVVRVLSHGRESGNLKAYLDRNPLYKNQFDLGATIHFRVPGTQYIAIGYEATLLVEICQLYLEARRLKLLKPNQFKLAIQSEIILLSCAKVGIIALVDEATGFQAVRKKRALQIKLQAFIAEEMQDWARMFRPEFFFELARLEGIHYSPRSRPLRWGKYIMAFVYDAIDKDMGKALRVVNPDPHFKQNDHQLLTDFGRQQVHDQIERVITVMKLCTDMRDFKKKFDHVFKKSALQMSFSDIWESPE